VPPVVLNPHKSGVNCDEMSNFEACPRPPLCVRCKEAPGKVELAACKHLLCAACFETTAVGPPCPGCRDRAARVPAAVHVDVGGSEDTEVTVVHGYTMPRAVWQRTLDLRLADVVKRYDTYAGLFVATKALLIHVPKTGGTSFEDALFETRNRSQHAPLSYWKTRLDAPTYDALYKFAIVRHPFHRLVSGYTYWKDGALEGQMADQPFVHRCRTDLDTLPKFVAYLAEVKRTGQWDERDVQGCDGTCPIQFRPQAWFFLPRSAEGGEGTCTGGDGGGGSAGAATGAAWGLRELDHVGRYEDIQGAYRTVVGALSDRRQRHPQPLPCPAATTDIADSAANGEAGWPAELPHTRASLHPPTLPPCFQDPPFVRAVMDIYGIDFEAFGYSPDVY